MGKLTISDLDSFKTEREAAIKAIIHYASQYKGAIHYDELGASCATSISRTINTLMYSSESLQGHFVVCDEINIDQVVDWFLKNKDYACNRHTAAFYMGHYLKRKVNEFYRSVKRGSIESSIVIASHPQARKKLQKIYKLRSIQGVKQLRIEHR